jgi:sortase (surface protein transpeptidase)
MTTKYPTWFKPSQNTDIAYWKEVLPYPEDKSAPVYLVIPSVGMVVPIREMDNPEERVAYLQQQNEQVNINTYLQRGVLHYPSSASYGENGNAIILGHSSYFTNDP